VVGRHPDVDDRDVGPARSDDPQQRIGVPAASGDLDAGVLEQPRETVAQEHLVVGDHDAHGSSARRLSAVATTGPSDRADAILQQDRQGEAGSDLDDEPAVCDRGFHADVAGRREPRGLDHDRVGRRLRGGGAALGRHRDEHNRRDALAQPLERRTEPFLREHGRKQAVRELAQLACGGLQGLLGGPELTVRQALPAQRESRGPQ
jgi:hypothetical protein